MTLTTELLKQNLKHCIGRDTVEVVGYDGKFAVYHYNALICFIDLSNDIVLMNITYYDYSAATSRVRNTALELCGYNRYSKNYLNRIEEGKICDDIIKIVNLRSTRGYVAIEDLKRCVKHYL